MSLRTTPSGRADGSQLRYVAIQRALEAAIADGRIPPGSIVSEGELAQLFGVSRNPVRKAIAELVARRLLAPRTPTQGPVVMGKIATQPVEIRLTLDMLGLSEEAALDLRSSAQRVFEDVECMISTGFLFGSYQILEQEASDYYGVSRMTIREVLGRLRDRGLVEKVPYGAWVSQVLTADRVAQEYDLRKLLEPSALAAAAQAGVPAIERMITRVERVIDKPELFLSEIELIERDLHQTCMAASGNALLNRVIQENLVSQSIGLAFFRALPLLPDVVGLKEHLLILKAIYDVRTDDVIRLVSEHLTLACKRNKRRLKTLSSIGIKDLPSYFISLKPLVDVSGTLATPRRASLLG